MWLLRERLSYFWVKTSYIKLTALYVHSKNSKHLWSHSRAIMALDHSRLGLENKFFENKSGRIFFAFNRFTLQILTNKSGGVKTNLLYFLYIASEVKQYYFIIQTSDRMRYFTIFQDKLHVVNIQDDQSWTFSETVQKNFQNHPYDQPVLISIKPDTRWDNWLKCYKRA